MAVEIDFAIGYGTTIEPDVFTSIEEMILDDDDRDMWCDRWAQCLNTWTGEDYFVGVIYWYDIEGGVISLSGKRATLDPKDEQEFRDFYNKYHLEDFFEWSPHPCAVIFER